MRTARDYPGDDDAELRELSAAHIAIGGDGTVPPEGTDAGHEPDAVREVADPDVVREVQSAHDDRPGEADEQQCTGPDGRDRDERVDDRGVQQVEEFTVVREDVRFMLPKQIRQAMAAAAG